MKKIYVTKVLKSSKGETELDFENREKFGWKDWDEQDYIEIPKNYEDDGQEPIDIDKILKILQHAKDRHGVTHVNIRYHEGHHGYYIDAFEMRESTQEEIEGYENKFKEIKKIDKELNELHDKMEKLMKIRQQKKK